MQTHDRIGRRAFGKTLAGTAAGALVPAEAQAQTPPATDALLRAAREDRLREAREISQVPLPRTVEPAVHFKA